MPTKFQREVENRSHLSARSVIVTVVAAVAADKPLRFPDRNKVSVEAAIAAGPGRAVRMHRRAATQVSSHERKREHHRHKHAYEKPVQNQTNHDLPPFVETK